MVTVTAVGVDAYGGEALRPSRPSAAALPVAVAACSAHETRAALTCRKAARRAGRDDSTQLCTSASVGHSVAFSTSVSTSCTDPDAALDDCEGADVAWAA